MTAVYQLRDRDSKVPFYVGVTDDVSARGDEHAKRWPKAEIVVLAEGLPRDQALELEKKLIHANAGLLVNTAHNDGKKAMQLTLTSDMVWEVLEIIAELHHVSISRLAILCGLDPTTFNKSKRPGRWPSLHTVSRALTVTGISFEEFGKLLDRRTRRVTIRPAIDLPPLGYSLDD